MATTPALGSDTALPAGLSDWPTVVPSGATLADAELLLVGAMAPLAGFQTAAEAELVRREGRLADGTPWPAEVVLTTSEDVAGRAVAAGRLVLSDTESVPVALLEVTGSSPAAAGGVTLSGPLTALAPPTRGAFGRLRRPPADVRAELPAGPVLADLLDRPLLEPRLAALRSAAVGLGAHVLLLVRVAEPGPDGMPTETLLRSVLAAVPELAAATVVAVPLAHRGDPARDAGLAAQVAAAYGATHLFGDADPAARPGPPPVTLPGTMPVTMPVTMVRPGPEARVPDAEELRYLLDRPEPLPEELASPAVAHELLAWRPPRSERGVTVFFTGLSGSGKSTVARMLVDTLHERSERRVTLLDGDEVRHVLSSGLGFSRADRDRNIERIGWVAAQITRHGGIAVCAPIAPYAAARAAVRRMVEAAGDLVLVHVATPLEECERRDRKGLYAKARAGLIPEFTGVSDPYEAPVDADLVIDTAVLTTEEACARVLDLLTTRGYVPTLTEG